VSQSSASANSSCVEAGPDDLSRVQEDPDPDASAFKLLQRSASLGLKLVSHRRWLVGFMQWKLSHGTRCLSA
jgi:hypothetical protein